MAPSICRRTEPPPRSTRDTDASEVADVGGYLPDTGAARKIANAELSKMPPVMVFVTSGTLPCTQHARQVARPC